MDGQVDEAYLWENISFADEAARLAFVDALYNSASGKFLALGTSVANFDVQNDITQKGETLDDTYLFNSLADAEGDILYASGDNTWAKLPVGSSGDVLTVVDGVPEWIAGGGGAGDVTSSSLIADHTIVRGDGGAKGVQDSGISVDDSDNVSGVGTFGSGLITSSGKYLGTTVFLNE